MRARRARAAAARHRARPMRRAALAARARDRSRWYSACATLPSSKRSVSRAGSPGAVGGEPRFHAQRPGSVGALVQRRGQGDRQAGQRAGQRDLAATAHDAQQQTVGRLPTHRRGQPRQRAELGRSAQPVGADHAKGRETKAAVGLRAAVEAGVAAEHAGAAGGDRQALLGEVDARLGTAQQRRGRAPGARRCRTARPGPARRCVPRHRSGSRA